MIFINVLQVSIPRWCDYKACLLDSARLGFRVSIPRWCDYKDFFAISPIEPRYVSIPRWCDYKYTNENPIADPSMFQFQDGAIISSRGWVVKYLEGLFQFQDGAIIRVLRQINTNPFSKFQFQDGAIIRDLSLAKQAFDDSFNSKMVRL